MLTTLKFVKNLSDYYIKNRNRYFIAENGLPDNTIVYSRGKYFFCPNNLVIYKLWENHCTARYARHEVKDFINLVRGKKSLLDIGASSGMFSCIFQAEVAQGSILSVEPDNTAYDLLTQTIRLNNGTGGYNWKSAKVAMSDFDGEVSFDDGGFGGVIGTSGNKKQCRKLDTLCKEYNFIPDVIKIDIESYEYEVITSSMDFLQKNKASLQIEIHNEFIRQRGLDPEVIFKLLRELGYRGVGEEGDIGSQQVKKDIVHLHLVR